MRIRHIDHRNTWNVFFEKHGAPSFLQSWEWGEFQQQQGNEILRLGVYQDKILVGIALVIKIRSKRGRFLFIPHGPIISIKNLEFRIQDILSTLVNYLIKVAELERYYFIRIASIITRSTQTQQIFHDLNFKTAPVYMHAERIWHLPLVSPNNPTAYFSDQALLNHMRKSTRYSINRALREKVVIKKRTDKKAVDVFLKIYQQTANREQFVPFSRSFINDEFQTFSQTGNAIFLFAEHNGVYLASALIIFTKSTAFYHQGATTHSKIPGSHLLQWEAIREAKKRGCLFYNFWGIHQPGRTPKNWNGLTLFKQGFGGEQVDYLPTQDLILSPKYYLTYWYEKYLNWRRGV